MRIVFSYIFFFVSTLSLSNAANTLNFDGHIALGVAAIIDPYNFNRISVIGSTEHFGFNGETDINEDLKYYFKYSFNVNTSDGHIITLDSPDSLSPPQEHTYIGAQYKNLDVCVGAQESIPYRFVGNVDDIGYHYGVIAYPSTFNSQRLLTLVYSKDNIQLGSQIQLTGDIQSPKNGSGAPGLYNYAFGSQFIFDTLVISLAFNGYSTGAVSSSTDAASAQQETKNVDGNIVNYWGLSAQYDAYPSVGLFGSFNYLNRDPDAPASSGGRGKSVTINGRTSEYENITFSAGLTIDRFQLQFEKGPFRKYSNELIAHYYWPLSPSLDLRTELVIPGPMTYADNIAGQGSSGAINYYAWLVDLSYTF